MDDKWVKPPSEKGGGDENKLIKTMNSGLNKAYLK